MCISVWGLRSSGEASDELYLCLACRANQRVYLTFHLSITPSCTPHKRCTLNWRSGISVQSVVSQNSLVHKQTDTHTHSWEHCGNVLYKNKSPFFKDELIWIAVRSTGRERERHKPSDLSTIYTEHATTVFTVKAWNNHYCNYWFWMPSWLFLLNFQCYFWILHNV